MRVSDPIRRFCWKMAVLVFVMVLLGLRPAEAYSPEVCKEVVIWTETAIDWRANGYSARQAKRGGAETLDGEHEPYWFLIVEEVYAVPRHMLTGSERADWLTRIYRDCRQVEGDIL